MIVRGGTKVFCRSTTVTLLSAVVFCVVLMTGAARAEGNEAPKDGKSSEAAALKSELQGQEEELDRTVGELTKIGAELEEYRGQVEEARVRQKELGRRARGLSRELETQREASARSRSRLEDQVRFAYKGGDLQGILLLLEGLFAGDSKLSDASVTLQATRLLTESNRSIQYYKDTKQDLRFTLRQVKQSKAEYREFGETSEILVEDLKGRESALRASIERLGLRRDRMEGRIAQLEAEEEAGLLKRPPATGRADEVEARDRDDGPKDEPNQDGERDRQQEEEREEEREQSRERELEIARDEILAQPVEPIPYEEYVRLYKESADRYGFAGDWYVLAAVGKIESNHGENMGPSSAGAMGPMQFLPSTWSSYGVDGDGDGQANIMDPDDAIPAAAAYLRAGGAPDDWYAALFTYNRAGWYVEEVLAIAESYRRIHGDDTVGPYLEPAPAPAMETFPSSEPVPQLESKPDVGQDPREERPTEEPAPPPKKKNPQPADDALGTNKPSAPGSNGLDENEKTTPELQNPDAVADELTTQQQYQY